MFSLLVINRPKLLAGLDDVNKIFGNNETLENEININLIVNWNRMNCIAPETNKQPKNKN